MMYLPRDHIIHLHKARPITKIMVDQIILPMVILDHSSILLMLHGQTMVIQVLRETTDQITRDITVMEIKGPIMDITIQDTIDEVSVKFEQFLCECGCSIYRMSH